MRSHVESWIASPGWVSSASLLPARGAGPAREADGTAALAERLRARARRGGLRAAIGGALSIGTWVALWVWLVAALVAPSGLAGPGPRGAPSVALHPASGSRR